MAQAAYERAKIEVRATAQKQLEIDLKVVSPLVDSKWADFQQQIKTCMFMNEWQASVLEYYDAAGAAIDIPDLVHADHEIEIFRLHLNIRNAYQILIARNTKYRL